MRGLVSIVLVLALAGCGDEIGGIRLTIENDETNPMEIGEDIDAILLEIVGNLVTDPGDSAETCHPAPRPFVLTGPGRVELPMDMGIRLGDEPWVCVGVRLSGSFDDGEPFLLDEGYYCPSDLETQVSNYTLVLSSDCHPDEGMACEDGEPCLGGTCRISRVGEVFDVEPSVDYWCDGAAYRE